MKASFTVLAVAVGFGLAACGSSPRETSRSPAQSTSAPSPAETQESRMIRQVQAELRQKGYAVEFDGVMGPQTKSALRDFQQKEGMPASGDLDQKTMAALGLEQSGGSSAPQMADSQTIRQVQQQLKQRGYEVEADGLMGPKTSAAVREFQQKEGIDASGSLDQRTMTTLGVEKRNE